MKYLVVILSLLTLNLSAQIRIGLYQDARLATMNDYLGNKPPQLNLLLITSYSTKYFELNVNYELAKLHNPFHRISGGLGIHYQYKFLRIGQSFNAGYIIRPFSTSFSLGSHSYLAYVYKRFELVGLVQITQRTDWGNMIRWSGFIGINYKFFKTLTSKRIKKGNGAY